MPGLLFLALKKKFAILFIGLLLPALVFIFLKMFGRNEFAVPPLHTEVVENPPVDCGLEYRAPYVIADSVRAMLSLGKSPFMLMAFSPLQQQVRDVIEDFSQSVAVREFRPELISENEYIRRCILIVPDGNDLALVDREGRIRGYYDGSSRDDVDRLEAELKIMLGKY